MSIPLNIIYSYFETGDFPTEAQFKATFSSFFHKDEKIQQEAIEGLAQAFQSFASSEAFKKHLKDEDVHSNVLAKLDASNLSESDKEFWRSALRVDDIPANVALVDDGSSQEVYNKEQIEALYMALSDFTVSGKIRAEKIEALGLTEIIAATETSLTAFAANSANYTFEKNDFIAIPDGSGNYALYIYSKEALKLLQRIIYQQV